LFIPDPDFSPIPDLGSRGKKGTGSRIRNTATDEDLPCVGVLVSAAVRGEAGGHEYEVCLLIQLFWWRGRGRAALLLLLLRLLFARFHLGGSCSPPNLVQYTEFIGTDCSCSTFDLYF
jgi:hypothetical protein